MVKNAEPQCVGIRRLPYKTPDKSLSRISELTFDTEGSEKTILLHCRRLAMYRQLVATEK